jgi:hypothetical protein
MIKVNYGPIDSLMMMPEEVDYVVELIEQMPDDGVMVEWGCGGSTCKWLSVKKPTQRLITVEHNKQWYDKVSGAVAEVFGSVENFSLYHVPVGYGYYNHGFGGIEEENPFGVAQYVMPTVDVFDGDVFLIDGITRGAIAACIFLRRTKPEARVLIHDFAPRVPAYEWVSQFCEVKIIGETLAELTYAK